MGNSTVLRRTWLMRDSAMPLVCGGWKGRGKYDADEDEMMKWTDRREAQAKAQILELWDFFVNRLYIMIPIS